MSYRKVLEKQGFYQQPSADNFTGADASDAPIADNAVADDSSDSAMVPSLVSLDLDLGEVLSRTVQAAPLVNGDCQPCDNGDSSTSSSTIINVDAGLDTNGLATVPQGLCLPDVSVLSQPALAGLLAGGEYAGDQAEATGRTATDAPCGCESNADGAEASVVAQSGISINVGLSLGEDTSTDALSSLLNGTPLLGDAAQSDGLLAGAILAGRGDAENSAVISADPAPLSTLDGVVASTDLLHVFDCGDCST